MLINLNAFKVGKIHDIPRMHHGIGEVCRFLIGHAPKAYRHHPCGELVIRHASIGDSPDNEFYLFFCMSEAVTLLFDKFCIMHALSFRENRASYSTVTDFARFLGLSISQPLSEAI